MDQTITVQWGNKLRQLAEQGVQVLCDDPGGVIYSIRSSRAGGVIVKAQARVRLRAPPTKKMAAPSTQGRPSELVHLWYGEAA